MAPKAGSNRVKKDARRSQAPGEAYIQSRRRVIQGVTDPQSVIQGLIDAHRSRPMESRSQEWFQKSGWSVEVRTPKADTIPQREDSLDVSNEMLMDLLRSFVADQQSPRFNPVFRMVGNKVHNSGYRGLVQIHQDKETSLFLLHDRTNGPQGKENIYISWLPLNDLAGDR